MRQRRNQQSEVRDQKSEIIRQRSEIRGNKSDSSLMTHHSSLPTWKRISSDVNGEFGLYLILDQFLKSPAESRRAAAGWSGDRFDLYENAAGEVVYVSMSAWDTENDAREFFDAYVKRVQLQYPTAERNKASDTVIFGTNDGEVLVALKGLRVFTIGTPQSLKPESLLCALDAPNCRAPMAMLFSR